MVIERSRKPACSAAAVDSGIRRKPRPVFADEDASVPLYQSAVFSPADEPVTGMRDMSNLVRGNVVLIVLMVLLSLGVGTAYLAYAPPRYVARAALLIDPAASSMPEEYYIESQTHTMRSDLIVRAVIEQLDLVEAGIEQDDSGFLIDHARAAKRFVEQYVSSLASAPENVDPIQDAASILRRNLTITRPAMTPVVTIAYNSTDPGRAADIVNTLIGVYMEQQRRDATTASQQSVAWLTERLGETRQQLEDSESAVESFRAAHTILGTGVNHSVQAEQRVYELSMQIEVARNAVERARAPHASHMSEIAPDAPLRHASEGSEIAMFPDVSLTRGQLGTGFGTDLDTDASAQQILPAAGLFGPRVSKVRERQQAAGTDGDELDNALRELAALDESFQDATQRAGEARQQIVKLRELEASTQIYRTLHGNMLQRYQEAVQQSSLPVNDGARILIAARVPGSESQPRPLLVFAFAGAFGIALGMGAAALRARSRNQAAG